MVKVGLGTKGIDFDWKEGGNPFKPPPKGLEPIGDSGWYKSPDNLLPGDPLYCEYNSGSPVCGGNPFTNQGLGVEAEVNVDPCGFSARIGGAVAFVKLPEIDITYRKAGACRREYEAPPPIVPPPPIPEDFKKPPPDTPIPQGFGVDEYVAVAMVETRISYSQEWVGGNAGAYAVASTIDTTATGDLQCPSSHLFNGSPYSNYGPLQLASSSCEFTFSRSFTANTLWTQRTGFSSFQTTGNPIRYLIDSRQPLSVTYGTPNIYHNYRKAAHNPNFRGGELVEGRFGDIFQEPTIKNYYSSRTYPGVDDLGRGYEDTYIDIVSYFPIVIRRQNDPSRRPPPPPPPPEDCCMQCCFSSTPQQQQNYSDDSCCREVLAVVKRLEKNLGVYPGKVTIFDENENAAGAQSKVIEFTTVAQGLTRAIERVEKISQIIGINVLPLTVPETINDPINDNLLGAVWDWLTPDATRKINNLFEWNVWMLEQFSAVMGHWQQEIKLEDTDVLKPGEQGLPAEGKEPPKNKIVLTDVATTLKEMTLLNLQIYKSLGLTLDVALKTLTEGSSNAQQIAAIKSEIDEIVDFLDYPTDEGYVDCPVQITVPGTDVSQEEQNDLGKFLKPTHTKVKFQNWTGKDSLRDRFTHLSTLLSRPQH